MNTLLPDQPAAAAASIPAPGGATQLTHASVPGSASTQGRAPESCPPAQDRRMEAVVVLHRQHRRR